MDLLPLLRDRFSVRAYSDRPVEADKLDRVLSVAGISPTARNKQPQRLYVLQSEEALAKIARLSPCTFGAPVVLMMCFDRSQASDSKLNPGYDFGEMDASICLDEIMLAAAAEGLGTCWVGMFSQEEVREAFELPETYHVAALMPLGYPAEDAKPGPMHDRSLPLDELVTRL